MARTGLDYNPPLKCFICECQDRVLVRDHCHKSGHIRGIICDQCNSWIAIVEDKPHLVSRIPKVVIWVSRYQDRISEHLSRKLPFKYSKSSSKSLQNIAKYIASVSEN